ncbi:hypothetical protein [Alkalimarinus coralli]|uniref:hypothetical protein n=1 Tax=Alkalimarinus coralli TaxID=2935863 RepID=UPI00202B569D|nr:hypothetical protein [Alkalimarinus coralli]
MRSTQLSAITATLLDEDSSHQDVCLALDEFSHLCSSITGVKPDTSFDAWAEDSFLDYGVAINPQAAAYCIHDYQRSVVFIRGVYAAINVAKLRFPAQKLKILYAGCGPFATLLLPLMTQFESDELELHLLDIHQRSLDSVGRLLSQLGMDDYAVSLTQGDACTYQHPEDLHIIVAEVMQKALEQEPQVAVTANLAPQLCEKGIFIPEQIDVQLCLAQWDNERKQIEKNASAKSSRQRAKSMLRTPSVFRQPIGTIFTLSPANIVAGLSEKGSDGANLEFNTVVVNMPGIDHIDRYDVLMLTHIQVFEDYVLGDYESEITLPHKCYDFPPLQRFARYHVRYQLGTYPRFMFTLEPKAVSQA